MVHIAELVEFFLISAFSPLKALGTEGSLHLMLFGDDTDGLELSEKSSGLLINKELASPRPLP